MSWYRFTLFLYLLFSSNLNAAESLEELMQKGRIEFEKGQYTLASSDIKDALETYEDSMSQTQKAEVYGFLGLTYFQMNNVGNAKDPNDLYNAENLLNLAICLGGAAKDKARWLTSLASIRNNAAYFYQEALELSKDNLYATLNIRLAQSLQLTKEGKEEERLKELQQISDAIEGVKTAEDRARLEVNLASQVLNMPGSEKSLARSNFVKAQKDAKNLPRLLIEALDGLAQLAENEKKTEEALRLNQQALIIAQSANASDLSIDLELRQARLNQKAPPSSQTKALAAYMRAVDHIEAVRQDMPIEYKGGKSSFRTNFGDAYLELTNLLLQEAAQQNDEDKKQALLQHARKTVELLKQTEIEEFLGERCSLPTIDASKTELPEGTAVIYPIVLPDRLKILVGIKKQLYQLSPQTVKKTKLEKLVSELSESLKEGNKKYKEPSEELYRLLIKPVELLLEGQKIKTLVMIPDSILNPVPMAVLYDKNKYLIEKYALITSPGLTLLNMKSPTDTKSKILLAGMSRPGDVLKKLPTKLYKEQLEALMEPETDSSQQKTNNPSQKRFPNEERTENETTLSEPIKQKIRKMLSLDTTEKEFEALKNETLDDPAFKQEMQKNLSLVGVEMELNTLEKIDTEKDTIKNENFSIENFNERVNSQAYRIIHIASHGYFDSEENLSFLMANDNIIRIEDLENTLKSKKLKKQPLDLLVLSACQTAEGNDKVPMGLAGIAIKAKVNSALGSLWPVPDLSTPKLMEEFYKSLLKPNISKAEALQQAQIAFIHNEDKTINDPFFWSPFILVGNWQ